MEILADVDASYNVISRGSATGTYQAFPDSCRLDNGDIIAVFYAGYGHVSLPNDEYPNGGRICMVRSQDDGRTWSEPEVVYDDEFDNRDSHISQLSDGTVMISFFSLRANPDDETGYAFMGSPQIIRSFDNGKTWESESQFIEMDGEDWACSAPVRELADGTCLLPVYHQGKERAWGGVVRSHDKGRTWSKVIPIGKESGLFLPAETDIIQLQDGTLYAALRAVHEEGIHMHYSRSEDLGLSWSPVQDIGFFGHAPHFTRLRSGGIVLTYRGFLSPEWSTVHTALRISYDEAQTWSDHYTVDSCRGAYTSTVELSDNAILVVYYEEGENSAIRTARLRITEDA